MADPPTLRFLLLFQSSLTIDTVPLSFPAAVGEKLTLKVVLCPEGITTAELIPVMAYPVPLTVACFRFTSLPATFEIVTVCVLVEPAGVLPKDTVEGVKLICCAMA